MAEEKIVKIFWINEKGLEKQHELITERKLLKHKDTFHFIQVLKLSDTLELIDKRIDELKEEWKKHLKEEGGSCYCMASDDSCKPEVWKELSKIRKELTGSENETEQSEVLPKQDRRSSVGINRKEFLVETNSHEDKSLSENPKKNKELI